MTSTSWGEAIRGLRLGAALERDHYRAGDPVELVLSLRNEGAEPARLVHSHLLSEYSLNVTHDGAAVPMTDEAQRIVRNLEAWYSGARRVIAIPPGTVHVLDWKAPLHQWFEVGRPGRYAVQAQRRDWSDGDAVLTSGVAHFEVR